MHASKMLEHSRNALLEHSTGTQYVEKSNDFTRIQCWNTVEVHASKMLEHSRNALLEHSSSFGYKPPGGLYPKSQNTHSNSSSSQQQPAVASSSQQ